MMVKKKKAQTTIEILIIFGVLILGVILFGLFYFTNLHTKIDTSSTVQGTYSDIEKNLQGGDPQIIAASCDDGIKNGQETGIDCGGPCPACPTPNTVDLSLYLEPNNSTPQGAAGHKEFGILAIVKSFPDGQVYIKKIQVLNETGSPTDNCYYGENQITTSGLIFTDQLPMENPSYNNYEKLIDNFSCIEFGDYYFKITAGVLETNDADSTEERLKNISSLSGTIYLEPDGESEINYPFGLKAEVEDYFSDSDIQITKAYIIRNTVGTGNCFYNNGSWVNIPSTGVSVNLQMERNNGDYNLSLTNKFKCDSEGEYDIILTLHDIEESTSYDKNLTIQKNIAFDRCLFRDNPGDGTVANPYVIKTASDLDCMRYHLSKNFKLNQYIDLSHTLLSTETWYDQEHGWWPIGTETAPFFGSLDGNGYSIKNLYKYMACEEYGVGSDRDFFGGLFVMLKNARVSNLYLHNINNSGHGSNGLAWSVSGSVIENVHIDGDLGLLMPYSSPNGVSHHVYDSNFTNCSFTGNISGSGTAHGGLIGNIYFSTISNPDVNAYSYITNCFTDVNFYPTTDEAILNQLGGLVGSNQGGIISYSHSSGQIKGRGGAIGGLIGSNGIYNNGQSILNSWSDADVIAYGVAGGLIGSNGRGIITNSYARGDVYSEYYFVDGPNYYASPFAGGLSGTKTGIIFNTYSSGKATIMKEPGCTMGCGSAGGLIAGLGVDGDVVNSFWDLLNSGVTYSNGGIGKTTTEMKTQSTFTDADWDFINVWAIDEGSSYPYLIIPDTDLRDIEDDCYIIDGKEFCVGESTKDEDGETVIIDKEYSIDYKKDADYK
jgi:hypothetical protein